MRAVVVALGKIGLPVAALLARTAETVVGCDIDERTCELVNRGLAPWPGEAGLEEALAELVPAGRLRAQTDTAAALATSPDLVIAVPPLAVDGSGAPDHRILDAVVQEIGRGLQPGTTVSFETTLPVGTTRGRIAPRLQELSGLRADEDFFVVFSPERVSVGRIFSDLATYPKLVGGIGPSSERRGVELYGSFLSAEVWPMGSSEAAELTKLAETTYRDVNIALVNEFARFADGAGIDIARVIAAANSQPFSHLHHPGVAVGGHCIPVYPRLYLAGDPAAALPAAARAVNESMPAYAVELLAKELGGLQGRRVLILGIAYRGGVPETAFSGAFGVRDALAAAGAVPVAADPLYDAAALEAEGFVPWAGDEIDGVVLQADHAEYRGLTPADLPGVRAVVDGRDLLDVKSFAAAGIPVKRIGRPGGDQLAASSACSAATTRSPARPSP
ncbi:MAG: nucleotide sugar dehydrogenase [Actinomycetota bacterium]|nr:nucleotide sugar dehydrogenase [Actinomycetota bacterium]